MKPPNSEQPRLASLRFRVNKEERRYVENLAAKAGMSMTDYLRSLVNLPPLSPGAPLGNKNRSKKR